MSSRSSPRVIAIVTSPLPPKVRPTSCRVRAGTSAVRRRELQVGVSLNLSRLLADAAYGGQRGSTRVQQAADLAFELVQFPVRAHGRAWSD